MLTTVTSHETNGQPSTRPEIGENPNYLGRSVTLSDSRRRRGAFRGHKLQDAPSSRPAPLEPRAVMKLALVVLLALLGGAQAAADLECCVMCGVVLTDPRFAGLITADEAGALLPDSCCCAATSCTLCGAVRTLCSEASGSCTDELLPQ